MRIVVAGATGLIGRAICERLCSDYEIVALSRNPQEAQAILSNKIRVVQWDVISPGQAAQQIDGSLAVINLAGENIASGRWTPSKKQRILQSRLDATGSIVQAITSARQKPDVLIQASAIGYYGYDRQEQMDESSGPGSGFLAQVCEKWEQQAKLVEKTGCRCVIIRSGLVLSGQGGALSRLITAFKFYMGGFPGSGRQWVSWITIDDEVAAIRFLMGNRHLAGVFNLTTPNPVTMKALCRTIGRVLKRPCLLSIPVLALRLVFGTMADEILLSGQRVFPNRLLQAGFKFKFSDINAACEHVLQRGKL